MGACPRQEQAFLLTLRKSQQCWTADKGQSDAEQCCSMAGAAHAWVSSPSDWLYAWEGAHAPAICSFVAPSERCHGQLCWGKVDAASVCDVLELLCELVAKAFSWQMACTTRSMQNSMTAQIGSAVPGVCWCSATTDRREEGHSYRTGHPPAGSH